MPSDRYGLISTVELCKASGATYRHVDHWARHSVLEVARPADGSGSQRGFHPSEIAIARRLLAVCRLVRKLDGRLARQIAQALRNTPPDQPWTTVTSDDGQIILLVANVDSPPDWQTCPHIATGTEGTSYCTLSTSVGPITESGLVAFAERSTNHA